MQGVKKSWGGLPCPRDLRIALKEEVTRFDGIIYEFKWAFEKRGELVREGGMFSNQRK